MHHLSFQPLIVLNSEVNFRITKRTSTRMSFLLFSCVLRRIFLFATFGLCTASVARWEATEKTIENCFLLSFLSKVGSVTSQVYRGEVRRPYDESGICLHKLFKAMKNPADTTLNWLFVSKFVELLDKI